MSFEDDDDQLMKSYLFDLLSAAERARVDTRLVADPEFFERVEAFEEDLIVRWYRGLMSSDDRTSFERAYSAPDRQARVDTTVRLMQAVASSRSGGLRSQSSLTFWSIAASLVVAVGILAVLPRIWSPIQEPATLVVALTAVGERSAVSSVGHDLIKLSPAVTRVQLKVALPELIGSPVASAEISAIDRVAVRIYASPDVQWASNTGDLTITVPVATLPEGDYLLTVKGAAERSDVVIRRAFRVQLERGTLRSR